MGGKAGKPDYQLDSNTWTDQDNLMTVVFILSGGNPHVSLQHPAYQDH